MDGNQKKKIDVTCFFVAMEAARLTEHPIPEDWNEQRRLYGFPER